MDIKLTLAELNMVLAALGDRPFKDVHLLIRNIHDQALPQTKEASNGDTDVSVHRMQGSGNNGLRRTGDVQHAHTFNGRQEGDPGLS
jgi:hypothetical protein